MNTTSPSRPAQTPVAPLWRNRDYLLLWGGQAVSIVGSQASQLALPLLILAITGSPALAGILGGLRGLAYILFGLPAGALVDRWNRRRVLVLCDLGRAVALGSIPLALIAGHLTSVQLYGVSFVEGTLAIFFGLAETACLTRVVTAAQLPSAVAQSQATDAGSIVVGPSLAGALFGISRALPFAADAVSYGISAISILFIRAGLQEERVEQRRSLWLEIAEGVQWIWRQPALRVLLVLNGAINLVYGGWPLLLIELAQRKGAGAATIGLVFACCGVGTVLGALATPLAQRRFTIGQLVIGIAWVFAITQPLNAIAPNVLALGVFNALTFFFVPVTGGTQFSYRLLLVSDALQGRVNSVFRLAGFGGQSLGFFLTGALIAWRGPIGAVWISVIPAIGIALLPTLSASIRRVGRISAVI